MPNSDQNYNLPLEIWFLNRLKKGDPSTKNMQKYGERYKSIKSYLAENFYPWIGQALSAKDSNIYTDHSFEHFEKVIEYAGRLLGLDPSMPKTEIETATLYITEYEAYITLVAILFHDVGNIFNRYKHETKVLEIFNTLGDIACSDRTERRLISRIAQAHGGEVEDQSGRPTKDTIRTLIQNDKDTFNGFEFKPRAIAALVRFADEVCECRGRAAKIMLKLGLLKDGNKIFHAYANSIVSVDIDLSSKLIKLKYELYINEITSTFKKQKGEKMEDQYLIDEINQRLEKMFCELKYCQRFMSSIVAIEEIKAEITIYNNEDHEVKTQQFVLNEYGYPSPQFSFKEFYPDWCGEKICKELKGDNHV